MKRFLTALCTLVGCGPSAPAQTVVQSQFQPGQVWRYQTRPGEEASRLIVLKVEAHPKLGTIVHIQLSHLAIKSAKSPGGIATELAHLPYSEQAVASSVVKLEAERATPADWEEGYRLWKSSMDAGEAGIWTLPVAEMIAAMEGVLSGKK